MSVKKHPIGKSLQFCSLFRQAARGLKRPRFSLSFAFRPSSKKKRVYGRNMVPFPGANCAGGPVLFDRLGRRKNRLPVALRRSRGGQIARSPVFRPPEGLAPLCKGSCRRRRLRGCGFRIGAGNRLQAAFSCTRPTTPPLRIRSAPPLTQGRQGVVAGRAFFVAAGAAAW